jgi:uncharacterized protein
MLVDLNKISEPVHKIDGVFQPDEIVLDEDTMILRDRIEFKGTVEKHSYQIDIGGNIKGKAEINCSRCLKPLETELDISFTSSYISSEFESREKEIEISGDDLKVDFYQSEEIDIAQLIREQIILNVPQTALCKLDCAGLCQICGENKNEKKCDCSEREIDPRFKVLENLSREDKS